MRRFSTAQEFRANPAYEAVPFHRLDEGELAALGAEQFDPSDYGVLRPRPGSDLPTVAICRETALLFLTLKEPGPLPAYFELAFGRDSERQLERQLLDRILEIASPDGFVSGPEACTHLGLDSPLGTGGLAQLSHSALQYGQALELTDPLALSLKLYVYNQKPASPAWRRRLPDRAAVTEFLRLAPGGVNEARLRRGWSPIDGGDGWLLFEARAPKPTGAGSPSKLYVSPAPEALPEALGAVIDVLGDTEARHFKVGADLKGVLRPDKLVAYFAGREALLAAVEALRSRLGGMPSQGVPFTAEAAGRLLSWGADPQEISSGWGSSWRQWLTQRLAAALIDGRNAAAGALAGAPPGVFEPWRFALERIRLEGVDPETFSPTADWTGARAAP